MKKREKIVSIWRRCGFSLVLSLKINFLRSFVLVLDYISLESVVKYLFPYVSNNDVSLVLPVNCSRWCFLHCCIVFVYHRSFSIIHKQVFCFYHHFLYFLVVLRGYHLSSNRWSQLTIDLFPPLAQLTLSTVMRPPDEINEPHISSGASVKDILSLVPFIGELEELIMDPCPWADDESSFSSFPPSIPLLSSFVDASSSNFKLGYDASTNVFT